MASRNSPSDSPSRQAYGGADDEDILLLASEVGLLEADIGVALVRRHETRPELDALRPELQEPGDIFPREYPARGDDGQGATPARLEFRERFDHFGDESLEREIGIVDLLRLEAEMAARAGAFDDDAVGDIVVSFFPGLENKPGRPRRADDRHDLDAGPPDGLDRDAFDRQARPQEEHVDLLFDRGLEQLVEAVDGHHDVDPDHPGRLAAGLADLASQGPDVRGHGIGVVIVLDHADGVGGDDAYPALPGHGRGQIGERDADAHAALDDGQVRRLVTDPEPGHRVFRYAGFFELGDLGLEGREQTHGQAIIGV